MSCLSNSLYPKLNNNFFTTKTESTFPEAKDAQEIIFLVTAHKWNYDTEY